MLKKIGLDTLNQNLYNPSNTGEMKMTKPLNKALELLNKLQVYRKMTKTKDGEIKSELACLQRIPINDECAPSRLNLKKYIYLNSRDLTINEIEDVIKALTKTEK